MKLSIVYIVSASFGNSLNRPLGVFISLQSARELFRCLVLKGFVDVTLSKSELHYD